MFFITAALMFGNHLKVNEIQDQINFTDYKNINYKIMLIIDLLQLNVII